MMKRVQCLRLSIGILIGLLMLTTNIAASELRKLTVAEGGEQELLGFAATFSGDVGFAGAPGGTSQSGAGYLFDLTTGNKTYTLTPSVANGDDMFGFNAALSGRKLLVGDPGNPVAETMVEGAAYVFDVQSGTELTRLQPQDGFAGDEFGFGINLHDDLAIMGAPNLGRGRGVAYLFDVQTGSQLHRLTPSNSFDGDEFGFDVAVNANYAIVGAPGNFDTLGFVEGAAYLFDVNTGQQLHRLRPNNGFAGDEFGFDVAIDGTTVIVGAPNGGSGIGAAYLFDAESGQQIAQLTPDDANNGDDFGGSVDVSGSLALVGASGLNAVLGAAYVFDARNGRQLSKLSASDVNSGDAFGASVALSNNVALIGSPRDDDVDTNTGAAYLFQLDITGDFNSNGLFDAGDIDQLTQAIRDSETAPIYDLNGDGEVNPTDRAAWVNEIASTYFGDANLDFEFGSADLVFVLQAGEYEDLEPNNSSWAAGDFNGDFDFTSRDLILALETGAYEQGRRTAVDALPEPNGLILLAIGIMLLVSSRQRMMSS